MQTASSLQLRHLSAKPAENLLTRTRANVMQMRRNQHPFVEQEAAVDELHK